MAAPIYLIKGTASDGIAYDEQKYPAGYQRVEDDDEVKRQWLVRLGVMFRDEWKLSAGM